MADNTLGDLPELVRDSRLPAIFQSDDGYHYTIHDRAVFHRRKQTQVWVTIENLGSGGQGSVDLQANDESGKRQFRAVKTIRFHQSRVNENHKLYTRGLEAIFKFSQARYSPLFVRASGWFTSKSYIHIAMEYCERGDLYHYLQDPEKCPNNRLFEDEMCDIAVQILYALQEMHSENFAHRDIKPANILIEDHPPNPWRVKVGDFGPSKRNSDVESTTVRGTTSFMPPELLGYHQDPRRADPYPVDMWCLRQTVFRALAGRSTFLNIAEIRRYYDGEKQFPRELLEDVQKSKQAMHFLQSLLLPVPEKRLTAREALVHTWIRTDATDSISMQMITSTSIISPHEKFSRAVVPRNETSIASASWTDTLPFQDNHIQMEETTQKGKSKCDIEDVKFESMGRIAETNKSMYSGLTASGASAITELDVGNGTQIHDFADISTCKHGCVGSKRQKPGLIEAGDWALAYDEVMANLFVRLVEGIAFKQATKLRLDFPCLWPRDTFCL